MEIYGRQIYQRLSIGNGQRNTLTFLPDDFETTKRVYPLLLVHPGSGEVSTQGGVSALLKNGINKMIADGWNPYVNVPTAEKFIVLTVQADSTGYALTPAAVINALESNELIEGRYRKDAIFMTGLSLGACGTCYFFADDYAEKYLPMLAGLVPMSGVKLTPQNYNFEYIKAHPKPVWAFCGKTDTATRVNFAKLLEANVPDITMTWYNAGHSGWIDQYKNAKHPVSGYSVLEWCASLIPGAVEPEQPIKVISSTPTKITVEGPPLNASRLLKLGAVDVQYNVI